MNFNIDGDCDTQATQNIVALDGVEVGLAGITTQDDCRDYCLYKVNINKKASIGFGTTVSFTTFFCIIWYHNNYS